MGNQKRDDVLVIWHDAICLEVLECVYFLKILRPEREECCRFYIPDTNSGDYLRVQEREGKFIPDLKLVHRPEGVWDSLELGLAQAQDLASAVSGFHSKLNFCFKRLLTEEELQERRKEYERRDREAAVWSKIQNANYAIKAQIEERQRELRRLDLVPPTGYELAEASRFLPTCYASKNRSFGLFWNQRLKTLGPFDLIWRASFLEKGKRHFFIRADFVPVILAEYKEYVEARKKPAQPNIHYCIVCGNQIERLRKMTPKEWMMKMRCDPCIAVGRHPDKESKHCMLCGKVFSKAETEALGLKWNGRRNCTECRQTSKEEKPKEEGRDEDENEK